MMAPIKASKLENLKELQDLVAGHMELIEPGLKPLDTRVRIGAATVDVLALDRDGTLTLIAVGFVADDSLLLRALDAYTACVDSPDALRPHLRTARVSEQSPRVMFIAERVPEAFLKKVRHLRCERVNCLEFRFGLHFTAAGARGGGKAEAPAAPRQAGRAEAPAPRDGDQLDKLSSDLGKGADTPAEFPVGHVDEGKVKVVREYLQREFPALIIYDFYSHDGGVQMFHLQGNTGAVIHSAAVADDLLNDASERELKAFLEKTKFARTLEQAGQINVAVTRAGLKLEKT